MSPRGQSVGNHGRGFLESLRDLYQVAPDEATAIVMAITAELTAFLQGQPSMTEKAIAS